MSATFFASYSAIASSAFKVPDNSTVLSIAFDTASVRAGLIALACHALFCLTASTAALAATFMLFELVIVSVIALSYDILTNVNLYFFLSSTWYPSTAQRYTLLVRGIYFGF